MHFTIFSTFLKFPGIKNKAQESFCTQGLLTHVTDLWAWPPHQLATLALSWQAMPADSPSSPARAALVGGTGRTGSKGE
jgi:hypothetical protein